MCGGTAGLAGALIVCPTEHIKCRLQAISKTAPQVRESRRYRGQGCRRGGDLCFRDAALRKSKPALVCTSSGPVHQVVTADCTHLQRQPSSHLALIGTRLNCGLEVKGVSTSPTESMHATLVTFGDRLQASTAVDAPRPGPLTVIRQISAAGGPVALYRGMTPTLLREVPGSCAMFGSYEASKLLLARRQVGKGPWPIQHIYI